MQYYKGLWPVIIISVMVLIITKMLFRVFNSALLITLPVR